jgi:RNA methyltransferase, TrmH family
MLTKADLSRLRSLREKKHREAAGLFVVEGPKVVAELLPVPGLLTEVYVTPDWDGPRSDERLHPVSNVDMARASHFPTPSSVLAVGRIQRPVFDRTLLARGLTLALDGIQDPGNLGTLLRIADWYGASRLLCSPDCADLHSQKVINASMGSFARIPVFTASLSEALEGCPVPVLGCDLGGDSVHHLAPTTDAVVLIGSEGRGPSPAVRARLSRRVTIPRFGQAESLNAAVAAAVVLDNLRRPSVSDKA